MKAIYSAIALMIASSANAADSNNIIVSGSTAKDASAYAIDVVSDGTVSAFQVFIHFEGVSDKQIFLKSCLAGLPSGFQGRCDFSEGRVIVAVYHGQNAALPAGVLSLGSISVKGVPTGVRTTDAEMSNTRAEVVSNAAAVN